MYSANGIEELVPCSSGTWTEWVDRLDCRRHPALKQKLAAANTRAVDRGTKDHMSIRISHIGSKDQDKGDTKNHGWQDP